MFDQAALQKIQPPQEQRNFSLSFLSFSNFKLCLTLLISTTSRKIVYRP